MERGRRLLEARLKKFWTQKQAAEKLGVARLTLSRWEQGLSEPQPVNLERICSVYEIAPSELGLAHISTPVQHSPVEEVPLPFQQQDLTLRLMRLVWQWSPHTANYTTLQQQVSQEIEHSMDITRRNALRRLALLPIEMSGLSLVSLTLKAPEQEILAQCSAGLAACWSLRKGRELAFVSHVVSRYIPSLKLIAQSSLHRKVATDLLAQCYLLKGLLAWHVEGHEASIRYTHKAAQYGEVAGNDTMHILALRTSAAAHYYAGHYVQALQAAEQSRNILETGKDVPAIACSYVYAGLATYQAHNQQKQDAFRSLGKARDSFFAQSPTEPIPIWIDHYTGNLVLNDGRTHFHLGMHRQALDSYAQIHTDPAGSEAIRVEASLSEAMAEVYHVGNRDMEWVIEKWIQGIEGAKALKSEQRFSEAVTTYAAMCAAWPAEPRITSLREHIIHW